MSSSKPKQKLFIVLGPHRSGTSVMTSILEGLGAHLGDTLEAADDNPLGFKENAQIVNLNNKFMNSMGIDWMTPLEVASLEVSAKKISLYQNEVKKILNSLLLNKNKFIAIKDPRICLLGTYWFEIFEELNVEPCFINILRNPEAISASLSNRNNISSFDAAKITFNYLLEAEKISRNKNTFWISYEQLIAKPNEMVNRIADFFNLDIRDNKNVISKIIVNDLNHFNHTFSITRAGKSYDKIHDINLDLDLSSIKDFFDIIKYPDAHNDFNQLLPSIALNNLGKILDSRLGQGEKKIEILNNKIHEQDNQIKELKSKIEIYENNKLRTAIKFFLFVAIKAIYLILPLPEIIKIKLRSKVAPIFSKFFFLNKEKLVAPSVEHFSDNLNKVRLRASQSPLISVIIPVYNQIDYTVNCLVSLSNLLTEYSFEVIIVNDCSTDQTYSVLSKIDNLRIINNQTNQGFIKNCNLASQVANGKYIVFLNNDTYVMQDWLDPLVKTIQKDQNIKIVGSKIIYNHDTLQEAGGIIWRDGSGWNWGKNQNPEHPYYNYLRQVDYVSGCSFMIENNYFKDTGYFDSDLDFAYYEDTSKCFQVRAEDSKNKVVYQPFSQLIHYEGISNGTDLGSGLKSFQEKNKLVFYKKYKDFLKSHAQNGVNPFLSSDRYVKGHILIIDSITPRMNRDSGSIDQINLIKVLLSENYRIHFVPVDNFQKDGAYTEYLQNLGVNCIYFPFFNSLDDFLIETGDIFDAIFFYRYSNLISNLSVTKKLCSSAKNILMTVDLHHLRESRSSNNKFKNQQIKKLELDAIRKADISVVLSNFEKDYLINEGVSNSLKTIPLIRQAKPYKKRLFEKTKGIGFIGGYNHPPNVESFYWLVEEIWPQLIEEFNSKNLTIPKLYIAGSNMPQEFYNYRSDHIEILGFQESTSKFFDSINFSICALKSGAGLKGKVASSISYGVPVIGSKYAFEGFPNSIEEKNFFIEANTTKEFISCIDECMLKVKNYERISKKAWEYFDQNFTTDALRSEIISLLGD